MKKFVVAALLCTVISACDHDKSIANNETDSPAAPAVEITEPAPPAAVPVTDPAEFKVAEEEPGTIEIIEPAPTPGQRLDHGIEKTEHGLRKAAEATGGALRRVGEAIERKADEQSR